MTIDNATHIPTNFDPIVNVNEEYFSVEPIIDDDITKTVSKEYQTLIDRFRRKNHSDIFETTTNHVEININTEPNNISLLNNTFNYPIDSESNETDLDITELDKNSMEKLKIDDATRSKIFNDFFTTVNKNVEAKPSTVQTSVDNVDYSTYSHENSGDYDYENGTFGLMSSPEVKRRFSNESFAFSTNLPSRVPSIKTLQTPRPGFIEGKFLNILFLLVVLPIGSRIYNRPLV